MIRVTILALALVTSSSTAAQHMHHSSEAPTKVGQSAFEALEEIVTILRNDESTDWNRVDIDVLRDHLVDMDNVTTRSAAITKISDGKVIFSVTGKGAVVGSIKRMANAHAPMLSSETGWSVNVENNSNGVEMIVIPDSSQLSKVVRLGFYGVMTIGAHHQMHHMLIASGNDPH